MSSHRRLQTPALLALIAAATVASAALAAMPPPHGASPGISFPDTLPFRAWLAGVPPRRPTGFQEPATTSWPEGYGQGPGRAAATLPAASCVEWSTLAEGTDLIRIRSSMVYDPVRERMILYGGIWYGGPYNDVWVQSLSGAPGWTRLATAGDPPPGGWNRAFYDPIRDRLVVFHSGVDNVWALSLSGTATWSRLSTANAPDLVRWFALAYDPVRDRAIVFGGYTEDGDIVNASWALSMEDRAWSALPDAPGGYDLRAFYDPARDRLVALAGILDGTAGPAYALSLSGTPQWSYLAPAGTPPSPRLDFATTYDPVRDRLLLFGGYSQGRYVNELWELTLAGDRPAWAPLAPTNPPPPRELSNAIYDAPRERMVIFGGRNAQDTWSLPLTGPLGWSPLDDPHRVPSPRGAHTAIWDPPRERMVVFGGEGWDDPTMSDVRSLSLAGPPVWSLLAPAGPEPAGRASHSAIFDPPRDRMIVFGGREGSNAYLLSDVWACSLAGAPAWTPLVPTGVPPGKRSSHSAIYDPVRDRMIVFGGYDSALVYHNDAWALDLSGGGAWQQLNPSGTAPSPRVEHCAVYDPVRDRMIVISGFDRVTGFLNSVWALSLAGSGSWSQLSPAGAPPPTRDGSAVYDPSRDRVLLYGGFSASPEVYALDLSGEPRWSVAATNTPQPPRGGHSAIFDADHDRMVVFAGGGYENDVLAMIVPGNTVGLSTAVEPVAAGSVVVDPNQSCFATDAGVTLTAVPATGYGFVGWRGDASGTGNPLTVSMKTSKHVVAYFFGHLVTTQAAPAAGGTVTRVPDQPLYAPGATVTITATPNTGYGFTGWSGDAQGTANPLVITVNGQRIITANFAGYGVSVAVNPPGAGAVTRSPDQPTYAPGTALTLGVLPKGGYGFAAWSGDASGSINPLTMLVDGPKSLTAILEAIPATCGGWLQVPVPLVPGARWLPSTVWDPRRQRIILFGGYGNGAFRNDLWEFSPVASSWSPMSVIGTPPSPRDAAVAVYDPVRDRVVFIGGNNGQYLADAYQLQLSVAGNPTWAKMVTAGPAPVPRFLPSAVYDPLRDRVLLYGGWTLDPEPHALWEFRFAQAPATWNPLDLANPPPTRHGHSAIYDPAGDRMLIFGGSRFQAQELNDLFALTLAGAPAWQELHPAGEPPTKRTAALAAHDATRGRMIVFGGQNRDGWFEDTWALSLAHGPAWVNLTPYSGPAPEARSASGGAFDPVRGQLLLFGGYTPRVGDEGGLGDTWRLGLAQGHPLDLTVDTPGHGAVVRVPNQGCYSPGETVTLTPVAAPDYRFAGWSGDAGGSDSPLTVAMNGYRSIVARFEPVTTATLLAQFEAILTEQGVELRWRFGTPERVIGVAIERSVSAAGPWAVLPLTAREDTGVIVALDGTAEPGREYFYRLTATLRDGPHATFGPVSARLGELILESAITLLAPNPSAGVTQIQFAVARAGRVRILVVDIAGRVLTTLVDGPQKAGRYSAAWDGTAGRWRVPPGMYFVRLVTPDRTSIRRLAVVR